jgi:GNAT superfamily N-acetyltransferase
MNRFEATILPLTANSEALRSAARWRHEAFLQEDGFSIADSEAQLVKLAMDPKGPETALIALIDEAPAGICLLVLHEIEPAQDLSPWLASLYVAPQFRGQGVARRLVRAIEDHARRNGVARLHLYTVDAAELYRKCGWAIVERFSSKDVELTLMKRDL